MVGCPLAVPPAVERVLRKGLEKDPDRRYATAAEYAVAIDGCLRQLEYRAAVATD